MEKNSINFVRQRIKSLEKNLELMKDSIQDNEKEKFNQFKKEALNLNQEIDKQIR